MSFFTQWIQKIDWKKVFIFAALYTVVSFVVHQAEVLFTMGYYTDSNYFGLWSKSMMPGNGPPSSDFMIKSLVFAFVTGVSLAVIYYYLRDHLPKNTKRRALYFADLMVATSFIFFTFPVYLLFNVPVELLLAWFISGFIILLIAAFLLVKIIK